MLADSNLCSICTNHLPRGFMYELLFASFLPRARVRGTASTASPGPPDRVRRCPTAAAGPEESTVTVGQAEVILVSKRHG